MISIGGITMSAELTALLLKGVRRLPQEEQDEVLRELLGARVEQATMQGSMALPAPGRVSLSLAEVLPTGPVALREILAAESGGGPWRTVPVRLPVELHERLKQWCQLNNFSMAVVLRGLVARFLDEYGGPAGTTGAEEAAPA